MGMVSIFYIMKVLGSYQCVAAVATWESILIIAIACIVIGQSTQTCLFEKPLVMHFADVHIRCMHSIITHAMLCVGEILYKQTTKPTRRSVWTSARDFDNVCSCIRSIHIRYVIMVRKLCIQ